MPGYNERYYVFFSKGGYTKGALELARENTKLRLLTIDDLFDLSHTLF